MKEEIKSAIKYHKLCIVMGFIKVCKNHNSAFWSFICDGGQEQTYTCKIHLEQFHERMWWNRRNGLNFQLHCYELKQNDWNVFKFNLHNCEQCLRSLNIYFGIWKCRNESYFITSSQTKVSEV